ncbi:MAG: hypothetical protein OEM32_06000 [Acidimicrobiia bacterium]|nr:hypothetical protein [Acidimicrobiia bacterium]
MRGFFAAALGLLLIAATPQETLSDLESQGFYIENGSSASASLVGDAVAEASFAGGRLYVVVLAEEPDSGATFFSDAVLDSLGTGTVLVVAPETVGFSSDGETWDESQLNDAVEAGLAGSSDNDVVARFVNALTGSSLGLGGGGSGGGSGLIWFLVIVGGLGLLFFYLSRRSSRTAGGGRVSPQVAQFHEAARAKLADIANDILEMEDEVRLAEDHEVAAHYQRASATYSELIDEVDRLSDVEDLIEVIFRLDVAIWELDVAESILDGKTPPAKPERPKLETVQAPETRPTRPDFERRPQRQSSPAGPDMGSILMALLAMQNMGGLGRTPGQQPGGLGGAGRRPGSFGGGSRGGRIRGGGRRRG